MTDLGFDRRLSDRLAAYESRLPDAAAPSTHDALRRDGPRWPLIGVGALAAVAAVLAVAVLLGGPRDDIGDATPSPSASLLETSAPSASPSDPPPSETAAPSVLASPSPPNPTADLAWTEVAAFAVDGGASSVSAVLEHDGGLVAVGVAYDEPLPILGPTPPHEGRVWLSVDGTDWEDVTPAGTFERVALRFLQVAADGALIAHGWQESADGFAIGAAVTFESADGRSWQPIAQPFGDGAWPNVMAQGGRGSAAIVTDPTGPTLSVWWSADGRAWERVHDLGDQVSFALGAGDDGFAVVGTRSSGGTAEPFAIASGDGQAWFEADAPPGPAVAVAPRGGDWVAVSRDPTTVLGQPSEAQVWSSTNGLQWTPIGVYALGTVEREDVTCSEIPDSLLDGGRWLLSGTTLSFGCSEGGVQTRGTTVISLDGEDWRALPFGAPATELGLGTRIADALDVDGRLLLVGDRDRVATFWIGETP